jgi:hypothetical protein
MKHRLRALVAAALVTGFGCSPTARPDRAGQAGQVAETTPTTAAAPAERAGDAAPAIDFAAVVDSLSEPDAKFFSDNHVSNETSYLQVAPGLSRAAPPGGVYLGVGPEQNFTYIALTRPSVAFIVDIRRGNLLLHLLYKAAFDEASSRSHFLALLVGRPYDPAGAPGEGGTIGEVIAHAERLPPDEATFTTAHTRLRERIEQQYRVKLDARDGKTLELTHRAFFQRQLDLRFELHQKNGRKYPTLRELLGQADADGKAAGFLASEESFRLLQRMQREHRIVPVVGDFAGERALPGIAAWVRERKLSVSVFYVSNVEQYLFEPGVWAKWTRNVAALPVGDDSLFVRCWLDQGRKHPRQMKGHRTATTLHSMADFNQRQQQKPFQSFWSAVTEGIHDPVTGAAPPAAAERTATRP